MPTLGVMPTHQHDCSMCKFITSTMSSRGFVTDWYYHSFQGETVVARYSSEGADYSSWPRSIVMRDAHRPTSGAKGIHLFEPMLLARLILALHDKGGLG